MINPLVKTIFFPITKKYKTRDIVEPTFVFISKILSVKCAEYGIRSSVSFFGKQLIVCTIPVLILGSVDDINSFADSVRPVCHKTQFQIPAMLYFSINLRYVI